MRIGPSVVVDCRWVGHTGIGRVTALFLRGLTELEVDRGEWCFWGPEAIQSLVPGRTVTVSRHLPTRTLGQAQLGPGWRGGVRLSLHAVRPLLVRSRSVILLHDIIPARFGPMPRRALWNGYFRVAVRTAERVVVYSSATDERAREFGAPSARVRRIRMTIDPEMSLRVRRRRMAADVSGPPYLLFVGQVKPHKNLPRAILAFQRSAFAREGGSFVIAGATDAAIAALQNSPDLALGPNVQLRGRCTDEELEHLLAGASALILPSLEEGFGLTVLEAHVAGVPTLCSDIEAHKNHPAESVRFDPMSIESIAQAVDLAVQAPMPDQPSLLSPAAFARQIVQIVDELR